MLLGGISRQWAHGLVSSQAGFCPLLVPYPAPVCSTQTAQMCVIPWEYGTYFLKAMSLNLLHNSPMGQTHFHKTVEETKVQSCNISRRHDLKVYRSRVQMGVLWHQIHRLASIKQCDGVPSM